MGWNYLSIHWLWAHASKVLHALFTWATLYHFTIFSSSIFALRLILLWYESIRYALMPFLLWSVTFMLFYDCRNFACGTLVGKGVAILAPHVPHFADYQRCDTLWQTDNPSTSLVIRHGWFPWPPEPVWYGTAHDCQHSQSAHSAHCGVGRTLYWQLPPSRPSCRKGDGGVPALRRMDARGVQSPTGGVQPRQLGVLHLP